ncbi:hypothetical protein M8818_003748 [Zalaria obscura]|uniref:Uncharacterized protein n=1 Tax=Zalaria obscura TaxID=2024903 RepID=A0ACC3SGD3_9PEZI
MSPGIGPVVATAGGSRAFVEQLGADSIVDYRSETVVEDLRAALGGRKVYHVFDASNSVASVKYLTAVLEKGGSYTATTGLVGAQKEILEEAGVWHEQIWVGSVHDEKPAGGILFGAVMSKIFEMALSEGKLSGHPYELIPNGLAGVGEALVRLRDRKGGNAKFVYRISETPGL